MSGISLKLTNVFIEGDRQIGRDIGVIGLDAETQTVDPDSTSEILTCRWSCEVQLGGSCDSAVNRQSIFASISGCRTEVQSNHFFAGTTSIIRFVLKLEQNNTAVSLFISKSGGLFMRRDVLDKKGLGLFLLVLATLLLSCSRIKTIVCKAGTT